MLLLLDEALQRKEANNVDQAHYHNSYMVKRYIGLCRERVVSHAGEGVAMRVGWWQSTNPKNTFHLQSYRVDYSFFHSRD